MPPVRAGPFARTRCPAEPSRLSSSGARPRPKDHRTREAGRRLAQQYKPDKQRIPTITNQPATVVIAAACASSRCRRGLVLRLSRCESSLVLCDDEDIAFADAFGQVPDKFRANWTARMLAMNPPTDSSTAVTLANAVALLETRIKLFDFLL